MNRILFTHYGENQIRGSERCLLDLIKHLDRKLFTPVVWCNSELLEQEVKKLQVRVIKSDFPILLGWLPSRFDFRSFISVVRQGLRIVSEENIQIIHANSGAPNQWLNIIARIKKLPLVSHLHSRYPLRDRLSLGLLNTSLVVGVSQPVVSQLLDDGIAPDRVKVIPNGIDTSLQDQATPVDIRRLLNLESHDFVAMTVASLIYRKGIDMLIRAIACLRLQSCIHFLGERTDVAGLLRGEVDVFVSGAREEVFGLALAEANLASIPVIAPSVGGIPEVIEDSKTGILVPPENGIHIANAIQRLYKNPALKKKMGLAGRCRVIDNFSVEKYVSRFQNTYLDLIENKEKHLDIFKNGNPNLLLKMLVRGSLIYFNNLHNLIEHKFQIHRQQSRETWS